MPRPRGVLHYINFFFFVSVMGCVGSVMSEAILRLCRVRKDQICRVLTDALVCVYLDFSCCVFLGD